MATIEIILKIWPLILAIAAVMVWGLRLAYRIAGTVARIEADLKHHVTQLNDHEVRIRTLEESRARHSVAIEALQ